METTREADSGYPEENPAEFKSDDAGPSEESAVRESARPTEEAARAPSNDDGTATGNPLNAGVQREHDR